MSELLLKSQNTLHNHKSATRKLNFPSLLNRLLYSTRSKTQKTRMNITDETPKRKSGGMVGVGKTKTIMLTKH